MLCFCFVRIAWFTCWIESNTQLVRKQHQHGQISACHLRMCFHFTAEYVVHRSGALPRTSDYFWSPSLTAMYWLTSCVLSGPLHYVMGICCPLVLITSSCTKTHLVRNLFLPKLSLDFGHWHDYMIVSRGVCLRKGTHVVCVGPYYMNRWHLGAALRLLHEVHRNESLRWNLSGLTRMRWWTVCWHLLNRAEMTTSWHQHICFVFASSTQRIYFHLAASVNYCWKLPRGFRP